VVCDAEMDGRSDRATCSSVCRQRAYRLRHRKRPREILWCWGHGPDAFVPCRPHPIGYRPLIFHLADVWARRPIRYEEEVRDRPRTAAEITLGWYDQEPPPDFVPTPGWPS
jgi:hypothetical protein